MTQYETGACPLCAPGHCHHAGEAPKDPRIAKQYNRPPRK